MTLLLFVGCNQSNEPPTPVQNTGLWQVHQIEINTDEAIDGQEAALAEFPGCTWARQAWTFEDGTMRVGHDVLCPGEVVDEFVACRVAVESPATWDPAGFWTVGTTVRARSRVRAKAPGGFALPTSCSVEIEAGSYPVVKVSKPEWRWEMKLPSGVVLRLKIPDSDEPDFVLAMRGNP